MCSVVSDSFVTPWTVARQAPLSMEFSRQEYWSGLPFPSPGDLPDPQVEPQPPASPELAGRFFSTGVTWEAPKTVLISGYWGAYRVERRLHMQCGVAWPSQRSSQVSRMEEMNPAMPSVQLSFCSVWEPSRAPSVGQGQATDTPLLNPLLEGRTKIWQKVPPGSSLSFKVGRQGTHLWSHKGCTRGGRYHSPKTNLEFVRKRISCWTANQWWSVLLNPLDFCARAWRAQSCLSLCFRAALTQHCPSSLFLDVWGSLQSPSASGHIYQSLFL